MRDPLVYARRDLTCSSLSARTPGGLCESCEVGTYDVGLGGAEAGVAVEGFLPVVSGLINAAR